MCSIMVLIVYQLMDLQLTISKQKLDELSSQMSSVNWTVPDLNDETITWHKLQNSLTCCGLSSYENWTQFKPFDLANDYLPSSCCHYKRITCDGLEYCFIFHDKCDATIHGNIHQSCIQRAGELAYSVRQNNSFLLFAYVQLMQALLNLLMSWLESGRRGTRSTGAVEV